MIFALNNAYNSRKVIHRGVNPSAPIRAIARVSTLPSLTQRRHAQCACGGGCPSCTGLSLQRKALISTPGDRFEREADAVAEQVMRMPDPTSQEQGRGLSDASASGTGTEEGPKIQRLAHGEGGAGEVASDVTSRLGAGAPLDTASRAYFEPRFGHDFGKVRVHTGPQADTAAASVQARAFTLGRDVVFAAGEHDPASEDGKRLLAHELAHVVQQSGGVGVHDSQDHGGFPLSATSPLVQRRLLAQGEAEKIEDFLYVVQPAIGANLAWDADTHRIWMGDDWSTPATLPDAKARLSRIIHDRENDVEIFISAAPSAAEDGVQVDVDTLAALENASPGLGLNSLLDEIEEAYQARRARATEEARFRPSLSLIRPDQLCGGQACFDEEQFEFEKKRNDQRIAADHERWRKIASKPFNDRLKKARIMAPSDATGRSTVDEIWDYGIGHDLFLDTEEALVKGTVTQEREDKARRRAKESRRQFETAQYNNWVNQGTAFRNNLQLMTIQPFIFGAGAFGWRVAAVYDGFQLGATGHEVYKATGPEGSTAIVLSALVIGVLMRKTPSRPGVEGPPPITMGDIKSINDYERGLKHISEMEGRGKYNASGNVGMAMYDAATGDVILQVFGPRSGSSPRVIVWEGNIGRVNVPPNLTPIQIGNAIEEPVRQLVGQATRQMFPTKAANAHGPDLHIPNPPTNNP